MNRKNSILAIGPSSLGLVLAVACSFQVPKESEVFPSDAEGGKSSAEGGNTSRGGSKSGGGGGKAGGGKAGATTDGGSSSESGGSAGASSSGTSTTGGTGGAELGGASATGGTTSAGGTPSAGGSSTAPDPLSFGLVAHYPFNETSGTVANNVINSSMNGSYQGNCTHPSGRIGNAVALRNLSAGDYVELPPGLLKDLSATTVALWFRDYSNTRFGARLFDFGKGSTEHLYFIPYATKNVGDYQLVGVSGAVTFVSIMSAESVNLADALWHHLVLTWDNSAISIYLDGVLKKTQANPTALPSAISVTAPSWLGWDTDNTAMYCDIDELRIYDRVLTPELVATLRNRTQ